MGAKSVKTRPLLVLKTSAAQKMMQRDNFGLKPCSGLGRKLTSHFDSNGELSGACTPEESPRVEKRQDVVSPMNKEAIPKRKSISDRGKVIAIEIKNGKAKIGLKKLGIRSQEQSCIETNSKEIPVSRPSNKSLKPEIRRNPRFSDYSKSPRSGGLNAGQSEKGKITEAAINDLFVTGSRSQGKYTTVTFTKSLVRKKLTDKKPKVSINFNPQREIRSGLMPLLHEALNVAGDMDRAQRRGSTRSVNNLLPHGAGKGAFQQHIEFFNAGLVRESDRKTMYLPKVLHNPPTTPKILRLFVSKDDQNTPKSRAEQKWKWMGTHGTAEDD